MLRTRRALGAPAVLLFLLLAVTACADGGATGDTQAETTTGPTAVAEDGEDQTAETEQPGTEPADGEQAGSEQPDGAAGGPPATEAAGVQIAGQADTKPEITLPGDEPPTELVIVDLVEGDGAEATPGATVTTHYVGVSWLNDGTQFDASWDRGEPISFSLSGVIPGWTEGIPGMRVGGRRMLIIPPDMAYGDLPPEGAAIAINDTLVFVIDLVDVQ